MLKYFLAAIIGLGLLCVAPQVSAIDLGSGLTKNAADKAGYGAANETTLAETIGYVIKVILSVTGIIFTALMVYAGFLWMTAKGDESKVEKAQETIKAAIIGLVITLGAYSVTEFVVPKVLEKMNGSQPVPGNK